jgi:hypothetical protein
LIEGLARKDALMCRLPAITRIGDVFVRIWISPTKKSADGFVLIHPTNERTDILSHWRTPESVLSGG